MLQAVKAKDQSWDLSNHSLNQLLFEWESIAIDELLILRIWMYLIRDFIQTNLFLYSIINAIEKGCRDCDAALLQMLVH